MTFSIIFFGLVILAMAAVTSFALAAPLLRKQKTAGLTDNARDMALYRAQLAETEDDLSRDLLTDAEAKTARAEIHRRLLKADLAVEKSAPQGAAHKILAVAIIILLPLSAIGAYAMLGTPRLPDQPYAARLKNAAFLLATAAARLEMKMQTDPSASGYRHLGDIFYLLKSYPNAIRAYKIAAGRGEASAAFWSQLAVTRVMAANGVVSKAAHADFMRVLEKDKKDPQALFYIGLENAQQGQFRRAAAVWNVLQKETTATSPWKDMLDKHLRAAGKAGKFDAAKIAPRAPR